MITEAQAILIRAISTATTYDWATASGTCYTSAVDGERYKQLDALRREGLVEKELFGEDCPAYQWTVKPEGSAALKEYEAEHGEVKAL